MGKLKKPQFEIQFRSAPSPIPWSVRLRQLLKVMGRRFDFRVTSCVQLDDDGEDDKVGSDETE